MGILDASVKLEHACGARRSTQWEKIHPRCECSSLSRRQLQPFALRRRLHRSGAKVAHRSRISPGSQFISLWRRTAAIGPRPSDEQIAAKTSLRRRWAALGCCHAPLASNARQLVGDYTNPIQRQSSRSMPKCRWPVWAIRARATSAGRKGCLHFHQRWTAVVAAARQHHHALRRGS
jgi:hypothetical protein